MPTNIYGPGDHYDEEKSHVIPALIMKFRKAVINKQPKINWDQMPKENFYMLMI